MRAGGGRRIHAANQMFGLSSPATIEKQEKSTLRIANKGVLACREAIIGIPVPGLELRRGLLRSGCASLVAVIQSANLRYGNDGSECRRVHGPRFRCVFGQREVRPAFVIIRQEGLHVPVMTVSGLTMTKSDHQSIQSWNSHAHRNRSANVVLVGFPERRITERCSRRVRLSTAR